MGAAFLGQLASLLPRLPSLQVQRPVHVAAIVRSSKALFAEPSSSIDLSQWRGALSADLKRRLWLIFALGGLQGAVGWWMVDPKALILQVVEKSKRYGARRH